MKQMQKKRYKHILLWLAGARAVLGVIAIPLAPFLYKEHFLWLVVLRPSKEVLLAGTLFALDAKKESRILQMVLAAIPLSLFGVWLFYYLGRAWSDEIKKGKLGKVTDKVLPAERIKDMGKVLKKKGPRLVHLGRMAAFPSTVVAAAAGATDMKSRKFLPADGLGAIASIAEVIIAAFAIHKLGSGFEAEAKWAIKIGGFVIFLVAASLFGRYLKRES